MELAAFGLGHALSESLVDGVLVAREPVLLRFEQVEGAVDELSRLAVGAARDLSLDALFGGGIEGQAHGLSIARFAVREGLRRLVQPSLPGERRGGELHHGEALAAQRGGDCALLGVEGAMVLAGPAEAPAIACLVDYGFFDVGARPLRGCFLQCVHRVPFISLL